MKKIRITGGNELTGEIKISGAKNSAVALVPASILSDDIVTIDNIPDISDIDALNEILEYLGAKVKRCDGTMVIDSSTIENKEIPEEISKKLRASYYFMSALLGKYKHVEMYFPGGCSIGARPIDQTLKGFKALGATIIEDNNKFIIDAKELHGGHVYLDMPSVGATINTMLAAVKANGTTIIENAAKEPEIVNVATFLNNMGAKIKGAGTNEIRIKGVSKLNKGFTEVIPDRIEAGTYTIAGALMGNNLKISNIIPEHIEALTLKLQEMGVDLEINNDNIIVSKPDKYNSVNVKTLGYPGFATDLQQPLTPLLTYCTGTSKLEETIYENRFQNIPYLNDMGANIVIDKRKIYVTGPTKLVGKNVVATDLRAGACMVLAGLKAEGVTTISNVEHILRGYENIIEKLKNIGADIELIEEN
ncbi:MAG: UDP-N-acetylglucosamine 1-carboxyvinyltransferase [Firmicutes bacterium]|nr:UDP-N-acetylglucosamine 1-carboxyvinyltransferase [Bacillota bacterium]